MLDYEYDYRFAEYEYDMIGLDRPNQQFNNLTNLLFGFFILPQLVTHHYLCLTLLRRSSLFRREHFFPLKLLQYAANGFE